MKCLILVDIQNDFVEGGALPISGGRKIVPLVNQLQARFELIVATQDWHPKEHLSFAANHPGKNEGEVIDLDGLKQVLWPTHCVQDTPGADFVTGLDQGRWCRVIRKGTNPLIDSYSGFCDNGHRQATGLQDVLAEIGGSELFLAGLATDYCVKSTALDARTLGFPVTLIQEACRGVDLAPGDIQQALAEMREAGVKIVSAKEL